MRGAWPLPILAALAAGGCGQKGPLYLPDKAGKVVTSAPASPAPASPALAKPQAAPPEAATTPSSAPATQKAAPPEKDQDQDQNPPPPK